jgi:tetratricopeptide (TPR) repeat protein
MADWLDAADIYAHPSEAEGMPLAVMEAMAKGLPVIATAVGGIPEELGDTGRLLPPPTDPAATGQALADAITAWAADPDRRRATGAAGRQRAQALFREERMLAETLGVIDRALRPEPQRLARADPLGPPVLNEAPSSPGGAGAPRRNGDQAPGLRSEEAAREARALPLAPLSAEWHCRQGQLLAGQGKRAEAAASFREALRLQPDQADAHSGLGVALAQQGAVEEALGHLRQAMRLRPAHAPAHHNLGVALAQLDQVDAASHSLREALRLQPAYAEAHANLGNVLARQGQRDAALTHYQEALRLRRITPTCTTTSA